MNLLQIPRFIYWIPRWIFHEKLTSFGVQWVFRYNRVVQNNINLIGGLYFQSYYFKIQEVEYRSVYMEKNIEYPAVFQKKKKMTSHVEQIENVYWIITNI